MTGPEAACCEAVALDDGLPPRQDAGGGGTGGGWVSGSAGSADYEPPGAAVSSGSSSSSSLFSSTPSMTDDDDDEDGATSAPSSDRRHISSSSLCSFTSSESETSRTDGAAAAGGPLYELSTMLENLPALRTGLSKYYQGRSQSFTSLADVSCVEDLAKKTTPYTRRSKASRSYAAALGVKNRSSKKKAPRGSHELLLPRGKKPPAYQEGRGEVYRC